MPAKSETYWKNRADLGEGSTWYLDRWKDWYSKTLIKHCFKRVENLLRGKTILDAGCGDCWLDLWLIQKFACYVMGVDRFDYGRNKERVADRLMYVPGVDIELLPEVNLVKAWTPDVAVVCSVLECTNDWKKALASIMAVAPVTVLFEDLRMESPWYQVGLDYKHPITWDEFLVEALWIAKNDLHVHLKLKGITANVIDRALFVRTPKWLWWLVAPVTLLIDLTAQHMPVFKGWIEKHGRFRLVVVEQMER